MLEEMLVTVRDNPKIDPVLAVWTWEIPAYLFMGGLTAGIMLFASLMVLLNKEEMFPFVARKLPIWAPIVLSLGMLFLFLDLSHKLYVWRFYTSFQPSSPMSWGSWILLFVYPVSILLAACTLREGYPWLGRLVDRFRAGTAVIDFACRHRMAVAQWGLVLAVFLGFYTGILLSAFSARPFWNTGFLAPLFLVSGMSAAAAVVLLGTRSEYERHAFTRIDIVLLTLKLALIALLLVNLASGSRVQIEASQMVFGGEFAVPFWVFFVIPGLMIPLILEYWELKGKRRAWMLISPLLALYGGYMLRHLTVDLGQTSSYLSYINAFDPTLLDLLR
jgi:protein NrfD